MADADISRPVLNPILTLKVEPRRRATRGGGKSASSIVTNRLDRQRRTLSGQIKSILESIPKSSVYGNKVVLVASMFAEDSLAPSWAPRDLFTEKVGAQLMAPTGTGYLVEADTRLLPRLSELIEQTSNVAQQVDISRVQSIARFQFDHVLGERNLESIWESAALIEIAGQVSRQFVIWFQPFPTDEARVAALGAVEEIIGRRAISYSDRVDSTGNDLVAVSSDLAALNIQNHKVVRTLEQFAAHFSTPAVIVGLAEPGRLERLAASGAVVRINPVSPLESTESLPEDEADLILPNLESAPVVGVVDGGRHSNGYDAAEAWEYLPPLMPDDQADKSHGDQVTSIAVHGHELNGHLELPGLNCRVGTVQVVPRSELNTSPDLREFAAHLDAAMNNHPDTKVWNFSFNVAAECDDHMVSELGHIINSICRKHGNLPIISAGNRHNRVKQRIAPPADCESAIVVAGRQASSKGEVAGPCPNSRVGLGPGGMLKPDLSWFSTVHVVGGSQAIGTSFSAPLVSSLAAHTWQNLRSPTADLVRALMFEHSDGLAHSESLGWGSPYADNLPWECGPGTAAMAWTSSLSVGVEYLWDGIKIPPTMIVDGNLIGEIRLVAVLDPGLFNTAGLGNYLVTRVETSLSTTGPNGKRKKLTGSMPTETKENLARQFDAKWHPVRRYIKSFSRTALAGDELTLRARVFARDLWQFGVTAQSLPTFDVAFVLALTSPDDTSETYDSFVQAMSGNVESAVVSQEVEITG